MRKFILTTFAAPALFVSSAIAADLPRRSYAPSPQPSYSAPVQTAYNWTGFYAGVNAGYAWGSFGDVGNVSFGKPSGFTLGGTAGYNHQFNNGFVLGAEPRELGEQLLAFTGECFRDLSGDAGKHRHALGQQEQRIAGV